MPDWNKKAGRGNAKGRCPGCGKPTTVQMVVMARQTAAVAKKEGRPGNQKNLASCSVTLCEQHAHELFDQIAHAINERRKRD